MDTFSGLILQKCRTHMKEIRSLEIPQAAPKWFVPLPDDLVNSYWFAVVESGVDCYPFDIPTIEESIRARPGLCDSVHSVQWKGRGAGTSVCLVELTDTFERWSADEVAKWFSTEHPHVSVIIHDNRNFYWGFNPEFDTPIDEGVWNQWRRPGDKSIISGVLALLPREDCSTVFFGPTFDYKRKCWTANAAIWVCLKGLSSRYFFTHARPECFRSYPIHYWSCTAETTNSSGGMNMGEAELDDAWEYDVEHIQPGCAISSSRSTSVTLGPAISLFMPSCDDDLDGVLFLTVARPFKGKLCPGSPVYEYMNTSTQIGTLQVIDQDLDLAIVLIARSEKLSKLVKENAASTRMSELVHIEGQVPLCGDESCMKSGAKTHLTTGRMLSFDGVEHPTESFPYDVSNRGCLVYTDNNSKDGDCGAPVYCAESKGLIGIHQKQIEIKSVRGSSFFGVAICVNTITDFVRRSIPLAVVPSEM